MNRNTLAVFAVAVVVSISGLARAEKKAAAAPIDTDAKQAANYEEEGKRWWAHIQYLADDKLEGRLTGSEGYRKAADYVAARFKEYGLKPAGASGYFQPVSFEVQKVNESKSSLSLIRGGKTQPIMLGEEALLGARAPEPEQLEAPLVFVGYGLRIPEAKYDDFAGMDLHGKILVYMNGGPSTIAGALKSHARASQEFWKDVEQAGAVGVLSIPNPKSMDIPWSRMKLASSQPGMWLADSALQDVRSPKLTVVFNPAKADVLFAGSKHTLAELLALADQGKPLPRFSLEGSLKAKVASERSRVDAANIAGVLPGNDPKLKNEYVVYTAHLDHLGIGEPIQGDNIYNGAMDDGSGIASILEIARSLRESRAQLRRSVLFLAVCAEEKGLLGSRYFAGHPTVPKKDIVADLNIDMFLPLYPLKILTVEGVDESSLGDDARAVAASDGITVEPDQEPDRNLFIRSDQYNFIRKGIPALAFKFGAAKASPEARMQKQWLTERYHAPSDDANQPVDAAAAARFDELVMKLGEKVANDQDRPQWKKESFFRRFMQ